MSMCIVFNPEKITMSFEDTASKLGTSASAIQQLFKGHASDGLADSLAVSASAIQKFLNGQSSESIAEVLSISAAELQHLRNELDDSGAAGFILGLALGRSR